MSLETIVLPAASFRGTKLLVTLMMSQIVTA